jgi:hypothetical protein
MFNSKHKDARTFQSEQDPVCSNAKAILAFARGQFLDVTREANLQVFEPLSDVSSKRFWQGP